MVIGLYCCTIIFIIYYSFSCVDWELNYWKELWCGLWPQVPGGWHQRLNRRVGVNGTRTWPGMRFTRQRSAGGQTAAGGRQVCFRLVLFCTPLCLPSPVSSCTVSRLYLVRMLRAHYRTTPPAVPGSNPTVLTMIPVTVAYGKISLNKYPYSPLSEATTSK